MNGENGQKGFFRSRFSILGQAPRAWDSYLYWEKTDKAIVKRISTLIKDIQRNPSGGIGNPEPLKHALSDFWSRRINDEHRIVYKVSEDNFLIAQLRYHY